MTVQPSFGARAPRLVAAVFTTTIFVNAALLFAVQPMFSKMVLPLLGGTPSVWNTCMLFFQTALLGGYLYAHVTTRWLDVRRQSVLQLLLLVASAVVLPITVASGFHVPSTRAPVAWLVALLTVSLGAPFFMLSTGAPLLQRWFSRTGHPAATNPYFLYAASNLGSMAALVSYPVLVEPSLTLGMQSRLWSAGYIALIGLVTACALLARRGAPLATASPSTARAVRPTSDATAADVVDRPVTAGRTLRWVLLAFVPSSMLLGVTTYLSTDVAAIPLLWIVPLAIYLLTFVLAFASRVWFRPALLLALQAVFLVWLAMTMAVGLSGLVAVLAPAHLSALFLSAMVCHGALAEDRPPVAHLTEFYLWISVGGMLGGVFNVLVAPHLFDSVAEYPIAIVLAAAMRPLLTKRDSVRARWLDVGLPLAVAAGVLLLLHRGFPIPGMSVRASLVAFAVFALVCLAFQRRPVRFALGLGAIFAAAAWGLGRSEHLVYRARSFFGVHKVVRLDGVRALLHGTTIHGAQSIDPARSREPLTYYHRRGPIAQVFASLGPDMTRRVAVVGLGTGTLACYGRPGDAWTFYEIDPVVERIATTPEYFTFMRDCPPAKSVVIGDARLSLAHAADASFDLIVIDAFTSDAIPVHLLTREALQLYLRKLAPSGAIAFHISNRYLELAPVLVGVAHAVGAVAMLGSDTYLAPEDRGPNRSASEWVLVARTAAPIEPLESLRGWRVPPPTRERPWTDDFSNVLGVFHWR